MSLINRRWGQKTRLLLVIGSLTVYSVLLLVLHGFAHPTIQTMSLPLYVIPVIAAAWGFGLRGSIIVGLIALPINVLLLLILGHTIDQVFNGERVLITLLGTGASAVFGWMFELKDRLEAELAERKEAERREHEERAFAQELGSIGAAFNETLDLNEVFEQILASVGHIAPYDNAGIVLLEEGDPSVVLHKSRLDNVHWSAENARHLLKVSALNETVIIDQLPGQGGSCVSAPIRIKKQTIGFLILHSTRTHMFNKFHAQRLEAFASQAAVSIHNARMYQLLESNALELNMLYHATSFLLNATSVAELGQQIAQAVVQEFAQTDCGVMLLNEDTGDIMRLVRAGVYQVNATAPLHLGGAGMVPEALRAGRVLYAPDVTQNPHYVANDPRTRSELVIPLKVRGAVLGVLDLQSPEPDAFSARDQRILTAFAEQAAIALDNMRMYDTLHEFALDREQTVIERTAELHQAKERVEAILNSSSDTIILTLPDGHIEQSNRAFYDLFGYYIDEEFNWPLTRMVAADYQDSFSEALRQANETRLSQRIEVVARRKDGTCFDADVALSPIYERGVDGCKGIVCSLRDISDRKRMEQELREALNKERELRELKSRFISMASHEFRTPMATIMATTSLLQNYIDRMDETKKKRQFEKIEEQIRYMTGLLDDVLTIGRVEADRMEIDYEMLDLHVFFDELIEEFHQIRATHEVLFTCEGECRPIPVDRKFIREIVNNLLTNAAKYSPDGSKIYLELIHGPDEVIFRVRDEGIGIPEKDQAHLFEAFHRAENVGTIPGTGLGLAIVKHAVDLHGGSITFESQLNVGTTFTVRIPIQKVEEVVL